MIPNVLIHIGYHKTGTTWFQHELFNLKSPVFFPVGRNGLPMSLEKLFTGDENGQPISPFRSVHEQVSSEIARLLSGADLDVRIPVISHERLSGYPHSGGFDSKSLADRLYECFPQARIWCVIREQKSMLASLYHHYLKYGGTDSLEMYVNRKYDGKRPGYSPEFIKYVDLVRYYISLFPQGNVLVQPYEQFRLNPEQFIGQLGQFLDISIPIEDLNFSKQRNVHESYNIVRRFPSANALCRKTSLNGHSPFCVPYLTKWLRSKSRRRLQKLIGKSQSSGYSDQFRKNVASIIQNRYEESNKELSELIGIDLSQYGYHS